jgi:hypothetical protein
MVTPMSSGSVGRGMQLETGVLHLLHYVLPFLAVAILSLGPPVSGGEALIQRRAGSRCTTFLTKVLSLL